MRDYIDEPLSVFLEIINTCNCDCLICSNKRRYKNNEQKILSLTDIKYILGKLGYRPKQVVLTGGEIFLHPEIIQIVTFLREQKIGHTLYTNGLLASDFHKLMVGNPYLINVAVSLHSDKKTEHEAVCNVAGSFETVCNNIRSFCEKGVNVISNTVVTDNSPDNVVNTIHFCLGLGCSVAGLTRYIGHRDCETMATSPRRERMSEIISNILRNGLEAQVDVDCSAYCEIGDFAEICYSGSVFFSVKANGDLTPCLFSNYVLGNIFAEDFVRIWKSSKAENWRGLMAQPCLECVQLVDCGGTCRCLVSEELEHETYPFKKKRIGDCEIDPEAIKLYKNLKVCSRFHSYSGQKGVFLVQGKHVRYLDGVLGQLINGLKEKYTLGSLMSKYGSECVECILDLYEDNMVDLVA